jgi:hypothetical protein
MMIRLLDRCLKYCFLAVYTVVSIVLFDEVYEASGEVIDELFHIGQGLQFCQGNFSAVNRRFVYIFPLNFNSFSFLSSGIRRSQPSLDCTCCHQ